MRRRDFLLPVACAALAGCAKRNSKPLQTIRIGIGNYAAISPLYVALERGYFRDAGFDVQPEQVVRTGDTVALLASGHLDAAFAFAAPPVMNAVAQGMRSVRPARSTRCSAGSSPACSTTPARCATRS